MAQELAAGVWLLELGFPVVGANAFLVDDGEVTLVDAGLPWFGVRRELRDAGFSPTDVDRVLVTHYDVDHVGGLRNLPDLDAPVFVGERDANLLSGVYDPPLLHHKGAFHRLARELVTIPAHLDVFPLEDGAQVGGFTAFHTPGHNPGHTVYVHDELGVGLLGDLVWERHGVLSPPGGGTPTTGARFGGVSAASPSPYRRSRCSVWVTARPFGPAVRRHFQRSRVGCSRSQNRAGDSS
ncbi:MBL fold metallo-hydrolase [Haladaptatus sp. NG-WS-4]